MKHIIIESFKFEPDEIRSIRNMLDLLLHEIGLCDIAVKDELPWAYKQVFEGSEPYDVMVRQLRELRKLTTPDGGIDYK